MRINCCNGDLKIQSMINKLKKDYRNLSKHHVPIDSVRYYLFHKVDILVKHMRKKILC